MDRVKADVCVVCGEERESGCERDGVGVGVGADEEVDITS